MKNIFERYYDALEHQLAEAAMTDPTYQTSVKICRKAMRKLKSYVSQNDFSDLAEEIHFFKVIKPQFYSKYIYCVNLYNYLMKKPPGGEEVQRAYIAFHLAELKRFFDRNHAFYQYCRSGSTKLDEVLFTRGGFDVHAELEDFGEDENFSTSHDYKLSKIIANEKLEEYFNVEMSAVGKEEPVRSVPFRHPEWTASQTDAVELLYALKTSCAINHGNIDIAELVIIFDFIFQTELHETYHKLLDITRRKKEMFVFLSRLRASFYNFIIEKFK